MRWTLRALTVWAAVACGVAMAAGQTRLAPLGVNERYALSRLLEDADAVVVGTVFETVGTGSRRDGSFDEATLGVERAVKGEIGVKTIKVYADRSDGKTMPKLTEGDRAIWILHRHYNDARDETPLPGLTLLEGGDRQPVERLADVRELLAEFRMKLAARLTQADAVVEGTVLATEAIPRGGPVSEHDPGMLRATVRVESVEKGPVVAKTMTVFYAGSYDIGSYASPKLRVGEHAVLILGKTEGGYGFVLPGAQVRRANDRQPMEELPEIRRLLKVGTAVGR